MLPEEQPPVTVAERVPRASEPIDVDSSSIDVEDDEFMARRIAQEWSAQNDEVRAPIAPTRQVLQDDTEYFQDYGMPAHLANQFGSRGPGGHEASLSARRQPRGVFNQVAPTSSWDSRDPDDLLLEATGGASAQSAKSSRLARLFQPPFDIMSDLDFDSARSEARESQKWLMMNLQDNSDFASQTLNRDLWKDKEVKALVKEHFVFLQFVNISEDGLQYLQFYPVDKYPHIAIIDPRTRERVKTWNTALNAMEFISDVSEFLERFSLDEERQNPVQKRARQSTTRDTSTAGSQTISSNPDNTPNGQSAAPEQDNQTTQPTKIVDSKFANIRAVVSEEPAAGPNSTRVQFRLPSSRTVRRFLLQDPVRSIFEFVKAEVPEAKDRVFKLVFNRANLIDKLDISLSDAGLKNASLVVEFEDDA